MIILVIRIAMVVMTKSTGRMTCGCEETDLHVGELETAALSQVRKLDISSTHLLAKKTKFKRINLIPTSSPE